LADAYKIAAADFIIPILRTTSEIVTTLFLPVTALRKITAQYSRGQEIKEYVD
jgi:hypothetical protein